MQKSFSTNFSWVSPSDNSLTALSIRQNGQTVDFQLVDQKSGRKGLPEVPGGEQSDHREGLYNAGKFSGVFSVLDLPTKINPKTRSAVVS